MAKTFFKHCTHTAENAALGYKIRFRYKECIKKKYVDMTYLHTSLHSAPLGARPPYMNTKISSYKEKKLFTDKI